MNLEIRHTSIPDGLLDALERECRHLTYSSAKTLYHCIMPDYREIFVGVIGDGANGTYEWFIWNGDTETLRMSNSGFGCDGVALCCGLVESGAHRANGDHDLFLAWERRSR